MSTRIFIEPDCLENPHTQRLIKRHPSARILPCKHYQEIFSPKAQSFRLQKQAPDWIIAKKQGKAVWPTPAQFGFEDRENYYFSHLLNCPFDCRYCFLQGMYHSANYVWFINYEDIFAQIKTITENSDKPCVFFSGYDADSLAMEPVTQFVAHALPFFATLPEATLELRSKSVQIKSLLNHPPLANVVVAFSLTPHQVAQAVEHRAPSIAKRLKAIKALAEHGWKIGLRLDPIIDCVDFSAQYERLMKDLRAHCMSESIHSISTGPLRFPKKMLERMRAMYPKDRLLNQALTTQNGITSYKKSHEADRQQSVHQIIEKYFNQAVVFHCHNALSEE